jgi:hypothetical protein
LAALEIDSGANVVMFMHTPNEKVSSFRTRAYGNIGKKISETTSVSFVQIAIKSSCCRI